MFWYRIKQGDMRQGDTVIASGLYSGDHDHKNNPLAVNMPKQGPIPPGAYWIAEPRNTPLHGPYFIPLVPVTPGATIYNRDGFGIHGERVVGPPGYASEGCIIAPHEVRLIIGQWTGELLIVLTGNW